MRCYTLGKDVHFLEPPRIQHHHGLGIVSLRAGLAGIQFRKIFTDPESEKSRNQNRSLITRMAQYVDRGWRDILT